MVAAPQKSALDILKGAAKPKEKTSESKTPSVHRPDLTEKCERYAQVVQKLKALEAEKAMLAADLLPVGEAARIQESLKSGQVLSSVRLNNLTYISQASFSDVTSPEDVQRLKSEPDMVQYLDEQVQVAIDAAQLSPEWAAALVELQKAGIAKITSILKVRKQYLSDRTMHTGVAALHERVQVKNKAFFKA
jgi:hypothetical protein